MAGTLRLERAEIGDHCVTLVLSDGSRHDVASAWLREVCGCDRCRYPGTQRRRVEALSTPLTVGATTCGVSSDRSALLIEWADGHRSEVPVAEITKSQTGTTPASATSWGAELVDRLPRFAYGVVVGSRQGELAWLDTVQELGFAIVAGVPPTRAALYEIARSVGPIRPSNYEPVWAIEAVADPENEVVSTSGLSPHSDLPYRQLPPGLQFLLSVMADAPGGASTLVDGFRIADQIKAESIDHWRALTEQPVTYRFVDGESDFEIRAPVIEVHRDGSYGVIRHAPGLIAPLDPSPSRFEPLFEALRRFTDLTNDAAFQVVYRLAPGELLTFDNHRLLHGRQPFELPPGARRHLLGAYLDRDDLSSRIRVLRALPA